MTTARTTEIYTRSLHDALPISPTRIANPFQDQLMALSPQNQRLTLMRAIRDNGKRCGRVESTAYQDRKSTRLNSSHSQTSYAVFCLKKKTVGAGPVEHGAGHQR